MTLMRLKPNVSWHWLTRYGAAIAISGLTLTASAIARSAPVVPFDEPPCYMRTRDGRVVNLESLCRRSPIAPTQATPATNQQPAVPSQPSSPQTTSNQGSRPAVPDQSGSHARGNPDSDDGNY